MAFIWYIPVSQWTLLRDGPHVIVMFYRQSLLCRVAASVHRHFLGREASNIQLSFRVVRVSNASGSILRLHISELTCTWEVFEHCVPSSSEYLTRSITDSQSEFHCRSISIGVSRWRIHELRWILSNPNGPMSRLCLTLSPTSWHHYNG